LPEVREWEKAQSNWLAQRRFSHSKKCLHSYLILKPSVKLLDFFRVLKSVNLKLAKNEPSRLYTLIILLAKPVGTQRGSLEIELRLLAKLLGKSISQVSRDLNTLANHRNQYIVYELADGRFSRKARIVIPKYVK